MIAMRISSREFCQIPKENLRGKVVVFPTDTVYGIGALLDDPDGIAKIYRIKHRDEQKPLAILVGEIEAIYPFVREIGPEAKRIMEEYWPGELTLIFEKASDLPGSLTLNLPTIGFRMPDSEIALAILRRFGPLATTSINLSGQEPLNSIAEIEAQFGDQIDYLITDQVTLSKTSSTVIDVTKKPFRILRQGNIKIKV